MDVLTALLVTLVIIGLVLYALDHLPVPLSGPVKGWIGAIVAIVGAVYLAQRFLL